MSRLLPGLWLEPDSWEAFEGWLADCFASLDLADVFDVGPAHHRPADDDETAPCIQAVSLTNERVLLRLSTRPLCAPLLRSHGAVGVDPDTWHGPAEFGDGTQDWIVSADFAMLASACVTWFRDRHALDFRDLGCDHQEAWDLPSDPLPPPKRCRARGAGHWGPGYYRSNRGPLEEDWANLVRLDGEVIVLEMPDGQIERFRHHDPDRFAAAVARSGGNLIGLRPSRDQVGLLAVPNRSGRYLFRVAPDQGQPLDPCIVDDADALKSQEG